MGVSIVSLALFYLCLAVPAVKSEETNSTFLYQTSSAQLQVSKAINLTLFKESGDADKKTTTTVIATTLLPDAKDSTVTGTLAPGGNSTSMTISFKMGEGSFSKVDLKLTMVWSPEWFSYWNVSEMSVDYEASVEGQSYKANEAIDVAPKPGFTSSKHDANCQRDYQICAPVNLCWTCSDQKLLSKKAGANGSAEATVKDDDKVTVQLIFPDLILQPFFAGGGNKSQPLKFGYNWDCDPVFSSVLWVSLLLGLGFIVVLFWSCDMLATIYTPDKFDDPRGKPLVINQAE